MVRILSFLLPGRLSSSLFACLICLASCCLILLSQPTKLVPLFILSVASLGIHLPVLVMLILHSIERRRRNLGIDEERLRGVYVSGNQLGLTMAHAGIWLGIVGVFVADIAHSFTPPAIIMCPSHACGLYTLAVTLAYLHFFVVAIQLLGFALVIYEVQSAPRRVLPNRSLNNILKKSVSQLISIREEVRRVRALGGSEVQTPTTPREHGLYLHETAGTLARAESAVNLPTYANSVDYSTRRRRTRTTSATTSSASNRLQDQITLDDVVPVIVHVPSNSVGLELARLRSAYRSQSDNGRYPPPLSSDGITIVPAYQSENGGIDFSQTPDQRFSIGTPPSEEDSKHSDGLSSPSFVRFDVNRLDRSESAGITHVRRSPSPESRYSRRSEELHQTPRAVREILTGAVILNQTPVNHGPFNACDPDTPTTPTQERIVTPTK